jgi:hypothetical protein
MRAFNRSSASLPDRFIYIPRLVLSDNTPINNMPHHSGGKSSEESSLNTPILPLLTNVLGKADA